MIVVVKNQNYCFVDEETVDYPMGVRQSATIVFSEDLGRRSEKKLKEIENGLSHILSQQ